MQRLVYGLIGSSLFLCIIQMYGLQLPELTSILSGQFGGLTMLEKAILEYTTLVYKQTNQAHKRIYFAPLDIEALYLFSILLTERNLL